METIIIDRPLQAVEIIDISGSDLPDNPKGYLSGDSSEGVDVSQAGRRDDVSGLCSVLNALVEKLNSFCENLFSRQREAIAALAVEIARKVLVREINEGDYQIEEVVKQALAKVPTRNDLSIHLNPRDFSDIQKLIDKQNDNILKGIKFIADANVGPAECFIETPKGVIKAMIDQQLERIALALENA
jgi:flagellar biosynthesis/type III secretory pathway protein FliH